LAQHVNDKYLFDLTYDISERTNLLQLTDKDKENSELVNYAKDILTQYTKHPLFSEHLQFLWNRLDAGDPKLFGEGSYVAPFLSEHEYFHHLAKGFGRIEEKFEEKAQQAIIDEVEFDETMPFSRKLKALYFYKWKPPNYIGLEQQLSANPWYIYTIIAIVIVALLVIIIVSVARWRHLRSATFYRDGYEPIKPDRQRDNNRMKTEEIQKLLKSDTSSESDHETNNNVQYDHAEYTHFDSNHSAADSSTALITVQ